MAVHPLLGRCRTLCDVPNRLLCVFSLESSLPRTFQQVALVSFALPTRDDSGQEIHAPRTNGTPSERAWIVSLGLKPEVTLDGITYRWRGSLTDAEMVDLIRSNGGRAVEGWWDQIRPHSLGWVTARAGDGAVIGFVNVAWDGGDHAFLLDTKTHAVFQHKAIGTRLLEVAARHAEAAGCEWLHVDFEPGLEPFYLDACGFRPTPAGLIHLASLSDS